MSRYETTQLEIVVSTYSGVMSCGLESLCCLLAIVRNAKIPMEGVESRLMLSSIIMTVND